MALSKWRSIAKDIETFWACYAYTMSRLHTHTYYSCSKHFSGLLERRPLLKSSWCVLSTTLSPRMKATRSVFAGTSNFIHNTVPFVWKLPYISCREAVPSPLRVISAVPECIDRARVIRYVGWVCTRKKF